MANKRYFTTDKTGEEVEVDASLAKQLVQMGKKKPEDFTIEDIQTTQSPQGVTPQDITQARQERFQEMPTGEKFFSGVGKGMMDVYHGVGQFLKGTQEGDQYLYGQKITKAPPVETKAQYTQRVQEEMRPYEEARKGDFASGAGELVGSIAATAPIGGFFTPLGLMKAGAVEGGLVGALEFTDPDESALTNAVVGTAFGIGTAAGAKLVKKLGTKGYNSLMKRYADKNVQELEDLVKKYGWTELSLGDVTGKAGTRKAEVIAESKPLGMEKFRQKGHSEVSDWLDNYVKWRKVDGGTPGEVIQKSAQKKQRLVKKESSKLYKEVERLTGGAKVESSNTIKELNNILNKEFKSDIPAEETVVNWFEDFLGNVSSGKRNFSQLRANREILGKEARKYEVSDPPRMRLLLKLRDAVEKDMDEAINKQVESMTKRKATQMTKLAGEPIMNPYAPRYVKAENIKQVNKGKKLKTAYENARAHYVDQVLPYKTNPTLKAALRTTEPTKIYNSLVGDGLIDRAKIFYKALDEKGRKAVRYGVLQKAREKAINEDVAGRPISPAKFLNYLNKADDLKNVFWDKKGRKEIDGLKKLLNASVRFGQYAENPPTGNRLNITNLKREAWLTVGLSPVKTLMDKYFWIGPGKKFLLSASELDPASTAMGNLLYKMGTQLQKRAPQAGAATMEDL